MKKIKTLALCITTNAQETNIKIDNSTDFKDFIATIKGGGELKVLTTTEGVTINGIFLEGVAFDLFKDFINQVRK